MKILFPKWKHYLYDLSYRIRALKKYTYSGNYYPIIGVGDIQVVILGLNKYGKGGYFQRHLKVFYMWEFAKTILSRRWRNIATYRESEVATKIYLKLKSIKLEIIMSEIKLVKKFAEEVGISEKKIAKMDEDELIRAVVAAVDADKTYSKNFVAWYEDLPEEVFEEEVIEEEKEETPKAKKDKKLEEEKVKVSAKKLERLLDTISEAEEMSELKEILEDNEDLFPKKIFKIREFEALQEAMVEILEEYEEKSIEEEEPVIKKKAKKEEPEEEEEPVIKKKAKKEEPEEEVDNSKLIKKINKAEDVDDLKEIFKESTESFEGISTRGIQKFENLKAKMLKCLSDEDEEVPVKEKPSTETNDLEELAKLPAPFLKKKAKEMGIKTLPGYSKEKIMGLIAEKLGIEIEEKEEPVKVKVSKKEIQKEEVEVVEIDQTFVNQLVRAKDIEALIDVAKELGVKISILEKKSVKRLGAKLIEFLSEKEEEVEEEAPKAKKEKGKSIYKEIEKMVLDGISFKKIVKEVTPLFESKGEDDEEYIEKRVKQLVAIIKFDNEIED